MAASLTSSHAVILTFDSSAAWRVASSGAVVGSSSVCSSPHVKIRSFLLARMRLKTIGRRRRGRVLEGEKGKDSFQISFTDKPVLLEKRPFLVDQCDKLCVAKVDG